MKNTNKTTLLFTSILAIAAVVIVGLIAANAFTGKEPGTQTEKKKDTAHAHQTISSDEEFLSHMVAHHKEAIESSQRVLDFGIEGDVLRLAGEIVTAQTVEIEEMERVHMEWYRRSIPDADYTPMMRDLSELTGEALDKAYMEDMIVHHEGAVDMAEQILKVTKRNEIKELADNIIRTQRAEIKIMENWLMDHYGTQK